MGAPAMGTDMASRRLQRWRNKRNRTSATGAGSSAVTDPLQMRGSKGRPPSFATQRSPSRIESSTCSRPEYGSSASPRTSVSCRSSAAPDITPSPSSSFPSGCNCAKKKVTKSPLRGVRRLGPRRRMRFDTRRSSVSMCTGSTPSNSTLARKSRGGRPGEGAEGSAAATSSPEDIAVALTVASASALALSSALASFSAAFA
mmetsp:Transcript_92651/g.198618  ORF Transcript_92651/g.198618 Transcript_92651/m.198618 type:complete len:201 (+) Transcript_92651:1197-1799(+)